MDKNDLMENKVKYWVDIIIGQHLFVAYVPKICIIEFKMLVFL